MSTQPHSMPGASRARWGLDALRLPWGLSATTLGLISIVVLAAVLRVANIGAIGQSNMYYTAAVESMLQSWRNFFFVAAEPGGSVSVDKPPVGLWLQAISAYVLGVNGFAVVLPQLLAGIGSVIVLFYLVRRWFGDVAGLLAALAQAVTPVAIAVERNNTPDATLIFTLLLATWAFVRATETRRLRWLIAGAALVGVGFNIKMMQAFLPLPALYGLYFLGSEQGWWRKIRHLGVATLVLIPVSLSWAVIVDLTPVDQRPYVGSSDTNSALNLILGYNGVQRLLGNGPGGGMARPGTGAEFAPPAPPNAGGQGNVLVQPNDGGQALTDGARQDDGGFYRPGGPGGVAGGMFGTGTPGVLRLFQSGLAAQVSWLLPFGLLMIVGMACSMAWWRPTSARHRGVLLWGGWLLTCAAFFSVAGFFHQYYLAMMGPPLAALVGIGVAWLWQLYGTHPIRAALVLIGAAAVTLAFQVYATALYQTVRWWLAFPLALGGAGLLLLIAGVWRGGSRMARMSYGLVTAGLLAIPAIWSGYTTAYADTGMLPEAYGGTGARAGMLRGGPPMMGVATDAMPPMARDGGFGQGGVNEALLGYLEANTRDTKYLLVVPSSGTGAQYVLVTGRPVLYAGGFSGSDPVIDAEQLAALVGSGEARYVLWGEGGGRGGNAGIASYLQAACTVVDTAALGLTSDTDTRDGGMRGGPGGALTLYRCGS